MKAADRMETDVQAEPERSRASSMPSSPLSPLSGDETLVTVRGLKKVYGDFVALAGCDLEIARGEVFGLLGPNGAGKTTLIRSMLGFLSPSEGQVTIDGLSPQENEVELRKKVAYLPGDARLPGHPRGMRLLEFFAKLHPLADLDRSLKIANRLELDLTRRVGFMSTGMRQKLALSIVLGVASPLLILDEPTANLDPSVRAAVLDFVREAQAEGRTVILSSHVLSEIEETCDRVAFLRQGHLVHQLYLDDLAQRHRIHLRASAKPEPPEASEQSFEVSCLGGDKYRIDTQGDLANCLPWLQSLNPRQLRIEPYGLASVYRGVHLGDGSLEEQA